MCSRALGRKLTVLSHEPLNSVLLLSPANSIAMATADSKLRLPNSGALPDLESLQHSPEPAARRALGDHGTRPAGLSSNRNPGPCHLRPKM